LPPPRASVHPTAGHRVCPTCGRLGAAPALLEQPGARLQLHRHSAAAARSELRARASAYAAQHAAASAAGRPAAAGGLHVSCLGRGAAASHSAVLVAPQLGSLQSPPRAVTVLGLARSLRDAPPRHSAPRGCRSLARPRRSCRLQCTCRTPRCRPVRRARRREPRAGRGARSSRHGRAGRLVRRRRDRARRTAHLCAHVHDVARAPAGTLINKRHGDRPVFLSLLTYLLTCTLTSPPQAQPTCRGDLAETAKQGNKNNQQQSPKQNYGALY